MKRKDLIQHPLRFCTHHCCAHVWKIVFAWNATIKKTCMFFTGNRIINSIWISFLAVACYFFSSFSFISMLKIKSMVYWCDVSTAKEWQTLWPHKNKKNAMYRIHIIVFFMFAIFDFEKQIFLVFMIIHAAKTRHYVINVSDSFCNLLFFSSLSSQLIFIFHTNTHLYSFILTHIPFEP